jgi:RNA polymerase sigma-70 factor, ECF subfamily
MPLPESEIIEKATAGDVKAFRALVEKHQTFILRVAFKFVRNTNDAEDITQEAFIRLWNNLHKYKPEIKLTTWMYTIVTNLCLDFLRSSRFKHSKKTSSMDEDMKLYSNSTTVSDQVVDAELRSSILQLSEALTPKQKAVFVLRDIEELDVDEVCAILQESAANVKSNLYYARKKMSELIQRYYGTKKNDLL